MVTGAAGFLGSHTVRQLVASSVDVLALDLRSSDHLGCRSSRMSVMDPGLSEALVSADAVIHLAGPVASALRGSPKQARSLELDGTRNVVQSCIAARVPHLIYASSFYVYSGREKDGMVHEGTILDRGSAGEFGSIKLQSEALCHLLTRDTPTSVTILRFGSAYGVGGSNAVVNFFETGLRGQPIIIWGKGQRSNQYTHAEDIARGIDAVLQHRGGIFNLVSPQRTTGAELAHLLHRDFGFRVRFDKSRTEGPAFPYMSAQRATEALGWRPTNLSDGLQRTFAALRRAE